jgi:tRNA A-37 threonylcarbamoyl transferase component Bud32
MLRIHVSNRITELRSAEKDGETLIYIPRQIILLDCMFKALGFTACPIYLLLGEPRDQEIIGAAAKTLVRDLAGDLSVFSGAMDLFRVNVKYPLYRNLYRMGESGGDLYRYLASQYLENGAGDVDLAVSLYASRSGFIIRDQWMLREKPGSVGIRIKPDLRRASNIVESLGKPVYEYINPLSRILRSIRIPRTPDPLPPETLIEAVEGRVINYNMIRDRIAEIRERSYGERTIAKILGSMYSSRVVVDKESGVKLVIKRFSEYTSAKWLLLSPTVDLMTLIGIRPKALPSTRFWNEYRFSIELRRHGIRTPRILYIDPWSLTMIREYIDGEPLGVLIEQEGGIDRAIGIFMRTIAKIHSNGFCMVDTKPDNYIASDGMDAAYCVDLEQISQCRKPLHMAWDLAVFMYFTSLLAPEPVGDRVPEAFNWGMGIYLDSVTYDESTKNSVVRKLSDPRISSAFIMSLSIFSPSRLKLFIDILKKASSIK